MLIFMIFSLFSGFWCLKPSPVELPGRGFDFCGDLLLWGSRDFPSKNDKVLWRPRRLWPPEGY
ncbi:hypothetical protein, partial [Klebsiella pneumoniae]|uniref:hypothetical protein n=1 Tax=Klebsiella pneumoniae TaxID=573 RepID=UPI001A98E000